MPKPSETSHLFGARGGPGWPTWSPRGAEMDPTGSVNGAKNRCEKRVAKIHGFFIPLAPKIMKNDVQNESGNAAKSVPNPCLEKYRKNAKQSKILEK